MIAIIGGTMDGKESPIKTPWFDEGDETYLLISYKDAEKRTCLFFMLAGMTPAEALKIHLDREATRAGFQALP